MEEMSMTRHYALIALIPLAALAACGDKELTTPTAASTSTVRFVNATGTNLDVMNNGTLASSNLVTGGNTSCLTVNSASPSLAFNLAGFTVRQLVRSEE